MTWHWRNGRLLSPQEASAEDEGLARSIIGALLALVCGVAAWFLMGGMWDGPLKKVILLTACIGAFWLGSRFTRPLLRGLRWLFVIGLGLAAVVWFFKSGGA
ncbi:MAG: hypothetical protein WA956_02560 [Stenotrophomonas sp.]